MYQSNQARIQRKTLPLARPWDRIPAAGDPARPQLSLPSPSNPSNHNIWYQSALVR